MRLIVLLISTLGLCCKNNCTHKTIKKYDERNRLISEYSVNCQNKKDGFFTAYYLDGSIKARLDYSNDSLLGKQESFYGNGVLQSIGFYRENHLDSIQYYYYANEVLKYESFRLNGQLFGEQKEFDEEGRLKSIWFMMNDSGMTSSYDLDQSGNIVKKKGIPVSCIYDKNIQNIKSGDSLIAIFYLLVPPKYNYRCTLLEKTGLNDAITDSCRVEEINHNKGVLITKQYSRPGSYNLGLKLAISNDNFLTQTNDTLMLSIKVK